MALDLRDPWIQKEVSESLNAVVKWKAEKSDRNLSDTIRENRWVVSACKSAFDSASEIVKIIDSGSCVRILRSATDHKFNSVQIVKVITAGSPESVLLSDGDCQVYAQIASPRDEDRHKYTAFWNSDKLGLIEVKEYVTVVSAERPAAWQIYLQIHGFRYRGGACDPNVHIGQPIDVLNHEEVRKPFEVIRKWHTAKEIAHRRDGSESECSSVADARENTRILQHLGKGFAAKGKLPPASDETNIVPVESAEPWLSAGGTNLHPPVEALRSPASRSLFGTRAPDKASKRHADLMNLLSHVKKPMEHTDTIVEGVNDPFAPSKESEGRLVSAGTRRDFLAAENDDLDALSTVKGDLELQTPEQETKPLNQMNKMRVEKSLKAHRQRDPSIHSGDFTFVKYMLQAWRCPDDQSHLLDDPASWQYPRDELSRMESNIPHAILKELQPNVERSRSSKEWANKEDLSGKEKPNTEMPGVTPPETPTNEEGGTETGDESERSYEWEKSPSPRAPPKIAKPGLPPDSDVESEIPEKITTCLNDFTPKLEQQASQDSLTSWHIGHVSASTQDHGSANETGNGNDDSSDIEIAPPQTLSSQPTQSCRSPKSSNAPKKQPSTTPITITTIACSAGHESVQSSEVLTKPTSQEARNTHACLQTPRTSHSQGSPEAEYEASSQSEGGEMSSHPILSDLEASKQSSFSKRKSELVTPLKSGRSRSKRARKSPGAYSQTSEKLDQGQQKYSTPCTPLQPGSPTSVPETRAEIYRRFVEAHSDYKGDKEHFFNQCRKLAKVISSGRFASFKVQDRDDYIVCHYKDYLRWASAQASSGEEPLSYEDYYEVNATAPVERGSILTSDTLGSVLNRSPNSPLRADSNIGSASSHSQSRSSDRRSTKGEQDHLVTPSRMPKRQQQQQQQRQHTAPLTKLQLASQPIVLDDSEEEIEVAASHPLAHASSELPARDIYHLSTGIAAATSDIGIDGDGDANSSMSRRCVDAGREADAELPSMDSSAAAGGRRASGDGGEDWFKDGQTPFNLWAQQYKSLKVFGGSLLSSQEGGDGEERDGTTPLFDF